MSEVAVNVRGLMGDEGSAQQSARHKSADISAEMRSQPSSHAWFCPSMPAHEADVILTIGAGTRAASAGSWLCGDVIRFRFLYDNRRVGSNSGNNGGGGVV